MPPVTQTNGSTASAASPAGRTIAIVGGGFTGAAVALHLAARDDLAEAPPGPRRIVVFEPCPALGAGLAYGTSEPTHRINVPAERMSLYPDRPDSFLRHIEARDVTVADPDARDPGGHLFPRRSAFGAYVAHEVAPHLASGAIEHWREHVTAVVPHGAGWRLETETGRTLEADIVVLAASHPAPGLPRALSGLAGHPGLIAEGAHAQSLDAVGDEERILIVGNGLTAADVIATLDRRGHRGPIVAVSRRGLRSKGHPAVLQELSAEEPGNDFTHPPERSAARLLRRVRIAVREAAAAGVGWHAVIDAVRKQGQDIWRALPVSERRRLARHVRAYWDVHRFRIAPQVERVIDHAIADGQLTILAAGLRAARADADGIHVTLAHKRRGESAEIVVDRVIVTTGPAHGDILASQAFLRGLRDEGHLRLCDTGLGIACDGRSRAENAAGAPIDNLFIAGPLARGTFGELMGLPQVSEHALFVAREVEALLAATAGAGNAFPRPPEPREQDIRNRTTAS